MPRGLTTCRYGSLLGHLTAQTAHTYLSHLQFLHELQPITPLKDKYQERLARILTQNSAKVLYLTTCSLLFTGRMISTACRSSHRSLLLLLLLLLLLPLLPQVSKERVRVLEFMTDYDKLRSGHIPATSFRRALDLCGFILNAEEIAALEER